MVYIRDYSNGPFMSNGTYPLPQEARTNTTLLHDVGVYVSQSHTQIIYEIHASPASRWYR